MSVTVCYIDLTQSVGRINDVTQQRVVYREQTKVNCSWRRTSPLNRTTRLL